jgi:hypothetical protein
MVEDIEDIFDDDEEEEEQLRAQTPATKKKIANALKGKNNPAYKDGRRSYREKVHAKKGQIVDHKDGDSTNNAPSNLKKETPSQHNKKHHRELNFQKSGGRKPVPRGYKSKT